MQFDRLPRCRASIHYGGSAPRKRLSRRCRNWASVSFLTALWERAIAGTITENTKFDPGDNRGTFPRLSPEALKANRGLVEIIQTFAAQKHATPAQIALAWLLARKSWVVPIPGTTKLHRPEENIRSTLIELTANDLQELDSATAKIAVEGDRYPPDLERMTYR
jgi:hypothetical protein